MATIIAFPKVQQRCPLRFELGRQFVTPGAKARISGQEIMDCFSKHEAGDFGPIGDEDYDANVDAIRGGARIMSVYRCGARREHEVFVITEADRSVTTLLLAEEY